MTIYFQYGEKEVKHLKKVDKTLAKIIDQIGMIRREVNPDLFSALVHSIVGQQISTKAHNTVWERIKKELFNITPEVIERLPLEKIQRFGITYKKAGYIKSIAQKILTNEFNINSLISMSDKEVCATLSKLNGVGVWTAEMLMIFSMQRPNVLSYGDLAIHRGLQIVYNKTNIEKDLFNAYWKRFTPYASVASLYLWAVAGGAIDDMNN